MAQRAQGVAGISWASFVAGFSPLLIVAASFFNKKAYWKSEPRDYYLMAAAIVGIILWAITDNPNLALLFSLLADMLASIPTLIKAYRYPPSSTLPPIRSVGMHKHLTGLGRQAAMAYMESLSMHTGIRTAQEIWVAASASVLGR